MDSFWEGLGTALTGPRALAVLAPALVFWAGALGAVAWHEGLTRRQVETVADAWTGPHAATLLLAGGLGLVASSLVVDRLTLPALRLLEGYWPAWPGLRALRRRLIGRHARRLEAAEVRWQALYQARQLAPGAFAPAQQEALARLERRLRLAPADPRLRMPTALGNVLRAAEARPHDKYGLDARVCWPRLWLVLPADVRRELADARQTLDLATRTGLWAALFLGWTALAWWALPLGLAVAGLAYGWALAAAETYGDLLEAAFDLHRFALYEALRWPPPVEPDEEAAAGEHLTAYLLRGTAASGARFAPPGA
jgi:hypothetical protein